MKAALQVRITKAEADALYDDGWVDESKTTVVYGSTYYNTEVEYELNPDGQSYHVPMQYFSSDSFENAIQEVRIKQSYNGKPVTHIADFAFLDNTIKKLVIEESTDGHKIKVYNSVFSYAHIGEIDCGNSVEFINGEGEISNSVFCFSEVLTKVTLLGGISCFGESMFDSCTNLKEIRFKGTSFVNSIPTNIQNFTIKKDALKQCLQLGTSVNGKKEFFIPRNVTFVGENAFTGWTSNQRINSAHKITPYNWSSVWLGENPVVEVVWADVVVEFYNQLGEFLYSFSGQLGTTFMVPMNPEIPGYVSRWSDGFVAKRIEFFEDDKRIYLEHEREKTLDECKVNNIYFIYTAGQLDSVRNYALSGYSFSLSADIQLNSTTPWVPITEFKGTFNGNSHTISGLYISATQAGNYGLFGINSGSINKLNVEGNIDISSGTGTVYAGLLAGMNKNYINYCNTYAGTKSSVYYNGKTYYTAIKCNRVDSIIGGLVGYNANNIFNSKNYADVYGQGHIGGVVGYNYNSVSNIINDGNILYHYNSANKSIGGIIGINNGMVQNNCTNNGNIYFTNSSISAGMSLTPAIGTLVGCNTYNGNSYWLRGHQVYNYGTINGISNLTESQRKYIGGDVGKTLASTTDTGI